MSDKKDAEAADRLWGFIKRLSITTAFIALIAILLVYYLISSNGEAYFINEPIETFSLAILPNFAAALVAAIVSIGYFSEIQKEATEAQHNNLVAGIASIIPEAQNMSGIVKVHNPLDPRKFIQMAEKGENIKIMLTWVIDMGRIIPALEKSIRDGVTTKILQLDPESPSFAQRAKSRQLDIEAAKQYHRNLTRHLTELQTRFPKAKDHIEVRLYDGSPSIYMYLCDNSAFVGLLVYGTQVWDVPCIELRKLDSESLFVVLDRDFDSRWEKEWTSKLNLETGAYISRNK